MLAAATPGQVAAFCNMKPIIVLNVYLAWLMAWYAAIPAAARSEEESETNSNPIVLELFTSHGCSSCPPADALLSELGQRPDLASKIVPLAFHVDYWNSDAWSDPFSQSAFTERQKQYRLALHGYQIYTPQLVINGRTGMVGSLRIKVLSQIARAKAIAGAGKVRITRLAFDIQSASMPTAVTVSIHAELIQNPIIPAATLPVSAAIFENDLITHVAGGENANRELHNNYVVRSFFNAFDLPGKAPAEKDETIVIPLAENWKPENLGLAVFIQHPTTMAIHGADSIPFQNVH